MMKSAVSILFSFLLLCLFSCDNNNSIDILTPYQPLMEKVAFIGHKGAGDPPQYGYQKYFGNSFQSIQYAIRNTSGSEIDLQISADSTIWLFHDPEIKICDSSYINIALLTNQQIKEASKCNYSNELITLEELIEKLNTIGFTNKILSLDLKVLRNKEALKRFGKEDGLAKLVVNLTLKLRELNGFKILAEVPWNSYVPYFQKDNLFEVYLLTLKNEDFIKTTAAGYSADIKLFNSKERRVENNKKLQVWVSNSIDDLLQSVQLKANFIQSDNVPLLSFLEHSKTNQLSSNEIFKNKLIEANSGEEFVEIKNFPLNTLDSTFILQFKFQNETAIDAKTLLVFSCKNSNDKHLFWVGQPLQKNKTSFLQFINAKKLQIDGGTTLKVFVWNQSRSKIKLGHSTLTLWNF